MTDETKPPYWGCEMGVKKNELAETLNRLGSMEKRYVFQILPDTDPDTFIIVHHPIRYDDELQRIRAVLDKILRTIVHFIQGKTIITK